MKTFYLGTHQPGWLSWCDVPLMVSDRRLRTIKRPLPAMAPWVLDSGGFTELSMHGSWANGPSPREYAERVQRYQRAVGNLVWAAPQDWMTEPFILAKTGLSEVEHQWRTIDNWYQLHEAAPEVPFIKVVQGQKVDAYLRHVDFYRAAGIDLTREPIVGVGSVCRRQGTREAEDIFRALHDAGVTRLHGFGVKADGLRRYGHLLESADSMAWSFNARRSPRMEQCQEHKNCANCPRYALAWRRALLDSLEGRRPGDYQPPLFGAVA